MTEIIKNVLISTPEKKENFISRIINNRDNGTSRQRC